MDPDNTNNFVHGDISPDESLFQKISRKIKEFAQRQPPKRRLAIVSGVSIGVLISGVAGLQLYGPEAPEPDPLPVIESTYEPPPPAPTTVASRLSGVQVDPSLDARPVTAVVIENSIDARPQAGLKDAGVVFEAIAEGGITRFLALFQTEQPDHIGPIRSARPYYVRWARGFDAAYVHSGGSPEALALLRAIGVKDMDHGNYPGSFDRVSNRYAPHNVYTSMARLDQLRGSLGFNASEFTGFERIPPPDPDGEATPASGNEKASTIVFDISSANYNTSYTYNGETNTYARVMAGVPHVDERSGQQIQPTVLIALETSYGIHSNGIHSVYGNIGSGNILVFQNGEVVAGSWSKPTDTAELKFLDSAGNPLLLQPGQAWITAIPSGRYSYGP